MAKFEWTRRETLGLAKRACSRCLGFGLTVRHEERIPCECVLRRIFQLCYERWLQYVRQERHCSISGIDRSPRAAAMSYGRKSEEFIADFELIARRTLHAPSAEYRLFRGRYVLGADLELLMRRFEMDRPELTRKLVTIEAALGRAFRETQPYALFPIDEYLHGGRGRAGETAPAEVRDIGSAFPLLGVRS